MLNSRTNNPYRAVYRTRQLWFFYAALSGVGEYKTRKRNKPAVPLRLLTPDTKQNEGCSNERHHLRTLFN